MKKNFDSLTIKTRHKMSRKRASQKNTNCHIILNEMTNDCNMLVYSNIHDTSLLDEKLTVNKMLSVLIFLMVK
jgi:hypothetical protein